eukprot:CAMPEP_0114570488 /NCGR_PEP_ID=MMETSP0114-20121206/17228_1 /TAXON_ID=31324 /ORGANISM="Goniomonas sp, Strain m" /LENGTH=56 /DNA_ID=CAMNT_0001757521 /DNA_START=23 /DNA_END=193 /DNA_ORIENTATION=+
MLSQLIPHPYLDRWTYGAFGYPTDSSTKWTGPHDESASIDWQNVHSAVAVVPVCIR